MAREKVTITMDRAKADRARELSRAESTSDAVDIALDALIKREQLRRDLELYRQIPPTAEEIAMANAGSQGGVDDDTDWEAVYADML